MINEFRSILIDSPAITALVPAARIVHGTIAQSQPLPRITFFRVSSTELEELLQSNGVVAARMQVDLWAEDPASCEELELAVVNRIKRFNGVVDGQTFDNVFILSRNSMPTKPVSGQMYGTSRCSLDLLVQYREPIATNV